MKSNVIFNTSKCLVSLTAVQAELDRLASGLTEAQFHAPNPKGGWSVGFCIEHLILTGHGFLPAWDAAIEHAARTSGSNEIRYSLWQRMILNLMEPPCSMRMKTPPHFVPSARRSATETVRQFSKMHEAVIHRIKAAELVDTRRTKVRSPFSNHISYPLGFSFDFFSAHERRHLWQAWQVRRQYLPDTAPIEPAADRIPQT